MSLNTNEKKCAVCSAYLFEDDDVVHCPVCGAPHHRDCYKSVGHCGLEALHGTENQYNPKNENEESSAEKEETKPAVCAFCGQSLAEDTQFCPYCGSPNGRGVPFDRLSGFVHVDDNAEIEDGVTIKEAAPIVFTNLSRYIPRFMKMGKEKKTSWNWAAFFLPYGWSAFRKMYSASWALSLLMIISNLLTLPCSLAITRLPGFTDLSRGSAVLARFILENLDKIDSLALILAAVGTLLNLGVMLFGGIFGDYLYKKHVLRAAKEIKVSDDKETALRKKGGVNIFAFMLSLAAVSYLPSLIFAFI